MIYESYILILKVLFVLLISTVDSQQVNQQGNCHRPCISFSTCFRGQELLQFNKTLPNICYYIGHEPYVCCPSIFPQLIVDRSKLRISQKKCEEFYPPFLPDGAFGIVSGYETEPLEFPFMAAIGYGDPRDATYNCGGFLAERNFIITAAHCARYNGLPPSVVRIGGSPLSDNGTEPIRIVKVIIHPKYQSDTELNDIAILALGQHVDEIQPACLWSYGKLDLNYQKDAVSTGYGSTSFAGAFAKRLLKAYLTIIDNEVCKTHYGNQPILDTQLCVEGKSRTLNNTEIAIQDTCQGDSGGPLLLQTSLGFRPNAIGIVSYGQGCGTQIPGIYTNISSYIDWIESVIWPGNDGDEKFFLP